MAERITKIQRWLDLIAYLVVRRTPATFEEIAEHVPSYQDWNSEDAKAREAVRRMFERDKDELRNNGIPLRHVQFSVNFSADQIDGYLIENRDFYLPYLKLVASATEMAERRPDRNDIATVGLQAEDASLLLEGLRRVADVPSSPFAAEARSAFRKVAFDLDPDAFAPDSPVLFVESPRSTELVHVLRELSEALLTRKQVTFRYHGIYRNEETSREVRPYGLLFQEGHWYLIAHDNQRNAVRVFRAGRMEDVKANRNQPKTPDYEIPGDFTLDAWVGRKAWELGDNEEPAIDADVRFQFPLSLWAERNGHGTLVEQLPGGASIRRFRVLQVSAFLRWVLGLGGEAQIAGPPELQREFRARAAEIARAHGGEHA